jgi:CheY-like chemotaxis protein
MISMPGNYKHILLADDDTEDKELLEEAILLIDPEFVIDAVTKGRQVIEYLDSCTDQQLPGLMILDYSMPDFDGCQVVDTIRDEPPYQSIPKLI